MDTTSISGRNWELRQGDCLQVLSAMPSRSVDCIITDPPYWTLDKWRGIGTTTRLGGGRGGDKDADRFFPTVNMDYLKKVIQEFDRLLVKNAHAWIMCDGDTSSYILNYVRESGETAFKYSKLYPVLKRASTGGYRQGMGYHGRGSHEYVILLEKGRRRFTDENWPDVFEYVWDGAESTKGFTPSGKPYPTAKPVEFVKRLMHLSTSVGETVLNPFSGSGTAGVAAQAMDRKVILIDSQEKSIQTITNRLKEHEDVNPGKVSYTSRTVEPSALCLF